MKPTYTHTHSGETVSTAGADTSLQQQHKHRKDHTALWWSIKEHTIFLKLVSFPDVVPSRKVTQKISIGLECAAFCFNLIKTLILEKKLSRRVDFRHTGVLVAYPKELEKGRAL